MRIPKITDQSRIAFALWAVCIFAILYTPRILNSLIPSKPLKIERSRMKKIHQIEQLGKYTPSTNKKPKKFHPPAHRFNPNRYSQAEWVRLGLTPKQAAIILKFCKFPLKSNDDLRKIFVLPDELYQLIKDSTFYENGPHYSLNECEKFPEKNLAVQKINVAKMDSAQLVDLPGIGPFYAKMVMRYEKALGGYHSKEQLLEVYKMNEDIYAILSKYLDFSETNLRKIYINSATKDDLAKHPYIDIWQANSIIKMRKQLGGFQSLKELLDSHLIINETFEKILPYVSL